MRRRWPVGFAVIVGLFGIYSVSASAVALIALFTVAVHRRLGMAVLVALHLPGLGDAELLLGHRPFALGEGELPPGPDARRQHARALLARLSQREREVATAVDRGRSDAQISGELYMSVATVKQHVSRILTKLNLNNRTQIALLAHDADLAGTA